MNDPEAYLAVDGQEIDAALAPHDRTFREAWQLEGEAVVVDMALAREIHRNTIRAARKPRLLALDAQWFVASEADDATEKARVAGEKQALRDAPQDPRIEAASTPEQLMALTLAALLEPQEG